MNTRLDINSITFMNNQYGNFTLAGYDEIISQAFETHLKQYDHIALLKKGLALILLATTFNVYKKPIRGDKLEAIVSEGGINGVTLRVNVQIVKNDEVVVEAACFFGLFNMITHSLSRNMDKYFKNSVNTSTLEAVSKCPIEMDGEKVDEIIIKPSHIDALNHCNNQRYYEFVYDCLDKKQMSMNHFSRIEMFYQNEIKVNEKMHIYKKNLDSKLFVYGLKDNGKCSFKAILYFDL